MKHERNVACVSEGSASGVAKNIPSHSSFYAHKCIADDREDDAFSLQLNPETIGSSSDSEFHISISSDHETDESVTGVNLELQQAQCDYQGDYITSYI